MSDWKKDAAWRRDARNVKAPEGRPAGGSGRDTKRWCRGKIGVEHEPKCVDFQASKRWVGERCDALARWKLLVCTACGRELAVYLGGKDKFAWVTAPEWPVGETIGGAK